MTFSPAGKSRGSFAHTHNCLGYLTEAERLEHTHLEHRTNEIQGRLGIATDDIEEVCKVIHQLRQLETVAISRWELSILEQASAKILA